MEVRIPLSDLGECTLCDIRLQVKSHRKPRPQRYVCVCGGGGGVSEREVNYALDVIQGK